ncbi:MAG: beta-ketoacyl-[acyl-carrier-protein] synthase family protein [Phycisphaerae bacterium]
MADRRVAITGLGVVSAAGVGAESFHEALTTGRCCLKQIDLFDASNFPSRVGGQLDDFSARKFVPKNYRKSVKVMARDIEIAVAAADCAFRDAGINTRGIDPDSVDVDSGRLGCNIAAGLICTDLDELGMAVNTAVKDGRFDMKLWGESGINNLTPLWLLKYLPNMLSCHVTIIHGAEGPSNCITCGDAAAHMAVGESARIIARGDADVVVAGGAESKLNCMNLMRHTLLKRLCESSNDNPAGACRPFDTAHDGTIIGEGGGLLILEDFDRATQRGARIYAEVAGFGAACDPQGMDVTRPSAGGLGGAARKAMADAGTGPDDIDLIVAHGTGVPAEDRLESSAWFDALGDAAAKIPATAVTGSVGSLFSGAGGVELAAAALALRDQTVPPTANFTRPADGCGLSLSGEPRKAEIRNVLAGAFSVGGQSAACVIRRVEES